MDVLDALNHLVRQHQHRVQAEAPVAVIEEVFEAGAEQVHHEGRVIARGAHPVHFRGAQAVLQQLVQLGLVLDLRVLRLDLLHLDGNLGARFLADTEVDITEGTAAELCI